MRRKPNQAPADETFMAIDWTKCVGCGEEVRFEKMSVLTTGIFGIRKTLCKTCYPSIKKEDD